MMEYFTLDRTGVFLFKWWNVTSDGAYVLTCFGCVALSMMSVGLKVVRVKLMDQRRAKELETKMEQVETVTSESERCEAYRNSPSKATPCCSTECGLFYTMSGLLQFTVTVVDFFTMLLVMTFNVGVFLGVVSGYSFGTLLMGHMFIVGETVKGSGASTVNTGGEDPISPKKNVDNENPERGGDASPDGAADTFIGYSILMDPPCCGL